MVGSKFGDRNGANIGESLGVNRRPGGEPRPVATSAADAEDLGVGRLKGSATIRLDRIKAVEQVRTEFDEEAIRSLADSIAENDLQQPIKVRWSAEADRYIIVSGERRFRAMLLLGREEIPATITKQTDPGKLKAMQLVENLHRVELRPMELARGFRAWMDDTGSNAAAASRQFGVSEATVSRSIALLDLPEGVQDRVEAGEIAASVAYEVARAPAEHHEEIAGRIVDEGLNRAEAVEVVRQVERRAPRAGGKPRGRGAKPGKPAPVTSRVFKGQGGLKLTAERGRGIDALALLELLEQATALVRSETHLAEGAELARLLPPATDAA